jgi:hypothetical protein
MSLDKREADLMTLVQEWRVAYWKGQDDQNYAASWEDLDLETFASVNNMGVVILKEYRKLGELEHFGGFHFWLAERRKK